MNRYLQSACRRPAGILSTLLAFASLSAGPAIAQDVGVEAAQRSIFDTEICKVDSLDTRQCQRVWDFLKGKLPAADLRLGLLLVASNSDDSATAKKADDQLDKSNASDKRRDEISSEMSALIIDGEDACP